MKKTNNTYQPSGHFSTLIFGVLLLVSTSCDLIISTAETEGPLPEDVQNCETNDELCPNNTNDPDNPNFELPGLTVVSGIGSFNTPFVVNANQFNFAWEAVNSNGSPISFNYSYSIAIAEPGQTISESSFTQLGSSNSVNISNLNETFGNETYSFEVRARYNSEEVSFTGQFSVDAFQSRGFLFNPMNIRDNGDGNFTAFIYLDEIEESDDLTAFSLVVDFDNSQLSVLEEDIIIYDENSFLKRDNAEIIGFSEINSGSVTIDVGAAGNNLTPLSGGGAVGEITFRPTTGFSGSSTISISSSSELKASDGSSISILEFDSAEITQ